MAKMCLGVKNVFFEWLNLLLLRHFGIRISRHHAVREMVMSIRSEYGSYTPNFGICALIIVYVSIFCNPTILPIRLIVS